MTAIMWITLFLLGVYKSAQEEESVTDSYSYMPIINKNGDPVFISEELMKKLNSELEIWHLRPWLRTRTEVQDGIITEKTCRVIEPSSFPAGIFDEEQLRTGAFLLYALFGIYAFTLLAHVCNDYFIPCVELICEDLKIPQSCDLSAVFCRQFLNRVIFGYSLSLVTALFAVRVPAGRVHHMQNVAAATFMSVATSCPEFFVNVISTFLTESDMGIGTIVGSAIFNALGVAAIGGLAAIRPIVIETRPVTRDVIIYMINVGVLVAIVWDGQIEWYEAMVLGILYVLYFIVMFNSTRLFALYDKIIASCCKKENIDSIQVVGNTSENSVVEGNISKVFDDTSIIVNGLNQPEKVVVEKEELTPEASRSIWKFPKERALLYKVWWIYSWPLKLILGLTIPSPVKQRRFYPISFIMCIVWIGVNSYVVSWSMTVIGNTFLIPDSVMGMTFLAFGGCLPEACSIFIMSRRGIRTLGPVFQYVIINLHANWSILGALFHQPSKSTSIRDSGEGGIGVSNALGANSLAILFALGIPWLIRTLTLLAQGGEQTAVLISSDGIDMVVISLLLAVILLWFILFLGKFKLRKTVGGVLAALYIVFITFAILVEMEVIVGVERLEKC